MVVVGVLSIWNIIGIFILAIIGNGDSLVRRASGWEFVNPVFIHKHLRVNWIGAAMVSLLYTIICPIGAFCYWFYVLCTYGRK